MGGCSSDFDDLFQGSLVIILRNMTDSIKAFSTDDGFAFGTVPGRSGKSPDLPGISEKWVDVPQTSTTFFRDLW
jgi:hypothetical protein